MRTVPRWYVEQRDWGFFVHCVPYWPFPRRNGRSRCKRLPTLPCRHLWSLCWHGSLCGMLCRHLYREERGNAGQRLHRLPGRNVWLGKRQHRRCVPPMLCRHFQRGSCRIGLCHLPPLCSRHME